MGEFTTFASEEARRIACRCFILERWEVLLFNGVAAWHAGNLHALDGKYKNPYAKRGGLREYEWAMEQRNKLRDNLVNSPVLKCGN